VASTWPPSLAIASRSATTAVGGSPSAVAVGESPREPGSAAAFLRARVLGCFSEGSFFALDFLLVFLLSATGR
jgi:hypothetical protein